MPNERQKRFQMESMGKGTLFACYVGFVAVFLLLIFIAGVFSPSRMFDTHCKRWFRVDDNIDSHTPSQILVGRTPIEHISPTFTNWNQDFFFYLNIYRRPKFGKGEGKTGYEIFPFKVNVVILDERDDFKSINWDSKRSYARHLECSRSQLNNTKCPRPDDGNRCLSQSKPSDHLMCGVCRITLAHETFIDKERYRIGVRIANEESHKWSGLFEDVYIVETMFRYPSEQFTLFECYFRYILVFASLTVSIVFWMQNNYYAPWKQWSLEQKWTFILSVSLILFNNPLFLLGLYAESWVFPFLDTVFIDTYLIVVLSCALVFTDNLLKANRRLSNAAFYGPKFALLGTLWFVGLLSFAVARTKQKENIAENDIENVQVEGLEVFKVFVGILIGVYFIWLLYLIVRVIDQWNSDSRATIARRVKFLWFVVLCMLAAVSAGLFILVLKRDESMEPIEFFAYFALYNLFTYLLVVMYWPIRGVVSMYSVPKNNTSHYPPTQMDTIFDEEEDI